MGEDDFLEMQYEDRAGYPDDDYEPEDDLLPYFGGEDGFDCLG